MYYSIPKDEIRPLYYYPYLNKFRPSRQEPLQCNFANKARVIRMYTTPSPVHPLIWVYHKFITVIKLLPTKSLRSKLKNNTLYTYIHWSNVRKIEEKTRTETCNILVGSRVTTPFFFSYHDLQRYP